MDDFRIDEASFPGLQLVNAVSRSKAYGTFQQKKYF